MLDQSGSEQSSYGLSANFTKKIGEETLLIVKSDEKDIKLQWSPGVSYDVAKTELESEEKATRTLAVTISRFDWQIADGINQYFGVSFGEEEIEITDNTGSNSEDENTVFIWNAGIKFDVTTNTAFTFDYKLSQEELISDKTQHTAIANLKFLF